MGRCQVVRFFGEGSGKLTSPSVLRKILSSHGIQLIPELGQHFLVDENILRKIVDAAELSGEELAVEIGAGVGTLTVALAPKVKKLWAVEIDQRLIPILKEQTAPLSNVEIVKSDFLSLVLSDFGGRLIVVGNLPFGITSEILLKLIREREAVDRAVLTVQWEVAEKLFCAPGPKSSRLGVHLSAYFAIERIKRLSRTVFFPPPEVEAAVIRLRRLPHPRISAQEDFERVLAALFGARRKTLRRALSSLFPVSEIDQLLIDLGLDPKARGETLRLEEIDRLAQALAKRAKQG